MTANQEALLAEIDKLKPFTCQWDARDCLGYLRDSLAFASVAEEPLFAVPRLGAVAERISDLHSMALGQFWTMCEIHEARKKREFRELDGDLEGIDPIQFLITAYMQLSFICAAGRDPITFTVAAGSMALFLADQWAARYLTPPEPVAC